MEPIQFFCMLSTGGTSFSIMGQSVSTKGGIYREGETFQRLAVGTESHPASANTDSGHCGVQLLVSQLTSSANSVKFHLESARLVHGNFNEAFFLAS